MTERSARRGAARGGSVRRGEVWWGRATLPGGSRKRRPFLVVSADAFNCNEQYPKVMVVHLTSVRRQGGPFPWEVELPRGAANLPHTSVAKCAEIYTFFKSDLTRLQGTLPRQHRVEVDRALGVALELD